MFAGLKASMAGIGGDYVEGWHQLDDATAKQGPDLMRERALTQAEAARLGSDLVEAAGSLAQ